MIEQGHLRALQKAQELTNIAVAENRLGDAGIHAKQSAAIIELEQAKIEIFTRYGIEDLPFELENPQPESVSSVWSDQRLSELSRRAKNTLYRNGIEFDALPSLSDDTLLRLRNLGPKTLAEIRILQRKNS